MQLDGVVFPKLQFFCLIFQTAVDCTCLQKNQAVYSQTIFFYWPIFLRRDESGR